MLDVLGEPFVKKNQQACQNQQGAVHTLESERHVDRQKITFRLQLLRKTQVVWVVKQSDDGRLSEKMLPSEQLEQRGCTAKNHSDWFAAQGAADADGSSLGERRFS